MSREVPFDAEEICDGCGALGALDFYGDYYCYACAAALLGGKKNSTLTPDDQSHSALNRGEES